MKLHVVGHPLVDDVLSSLRDARTPSTEFRRLAHRVSLLVTAEATRDLPTAPGEIETPLETTAVRRLSRRVVAVPVLRAGRRVYDPPPLSAIRERTRAQLAGFHAGIKRFVNPDE